MEIQEAIKICHSSTSKEYIEKNNITKEQVYEAVDLLCEFAEMFLNRISEMGTNDIDSTSLYEEMMNPMSCFNMQWLSEKKRNI